MVPWSQIQARLNEADDLRNAAERERWAQQVTVRETPRRWYCCLLTRLGQKLVAVGQTLQAHYGETRPMNPRPKLSH